MLCAGVSLPSKTLSFFSLPFPALASLLAFLAASLATLLLTAFSIGFFYKQYSEEAEISSMSIASKIDEKLNLYYNNDIGLNLWGYRYDNTKQLI